MTPGGETEHPNRATGQWSGTCGSEALRCRPQPTPHTPEAGDAWPTGHGARDKPPTRGRTQSWRSTPPRMATRGREGRSGLGWTGFAKAPASTVAAARELGAPAHDSHVRERTRRSSARAAATSMLHRAWREEPKQNAFVKFARRDGARPAPFCRRPKVEQGLKRLAPYCDLCELEIKTDCSTHRACCVSKEPGRHDQP